MSRVVPKTGEALDLEPRKPLTPKQRAQVHADNDGLCYLCGHPIALEEMQDEHVICLGIGGSNDLRNRKPAHADCHKFKTALDRQVIAKVNRIRKREAGEVKPSRIKSRGLEGWRTFNGSIVRRGER